MRPYQASLLNSLILIVFGIWGFYASNTPSLTAFIPAVIGLLLLGMNDGIKNQNKVIAHVAVILTLLSFANIKPLMRVLCESEIDILSVFRTSIMLLSSLIAMIAFVKSFINARRS
tara:strand:- start:738 stop:1085 length:348 start_codon:yes stop_codon:yes gene_type:complete